MTIGNKPPLNPTKINRDPSMKAGNEKKKSTINVVNGQTGRVDADTYENLNLNCTAKTQIRIPDVGGLGSPDRVPASSDLGDEILGELASAEAESYAFEGYALEDASSESSDLKHPPEYYTSLSNISTMVQDPSQRYDLLTAVQVFAHTAPEMLEELARELVSFLPQSGVANDITDFTQTLVQYFPKAVLKEISLADVSMLDAALRFWPSEQQQLLSEKVGVEVSGLLASPPGQRDVKTLLNLNEELRSKYTQAVHNAPFLDPSVKFVGDDARIFGAAIARLSNPEIGEVLLSSLNDLEGKKAAALGTLLSSKNTTSKREAIADLGGLDNELVQHLLTTLMKSPYDLGFEDPVSPVIPFLQSTSMEALKANPAAQRTYAQALDQTLKITSDADIVVDLIDRNPYLAVEVLAFGAESIRNINFQGGPAKDSDAKRVFDTVLEHADQLFGEEDFVERSLDHPISQAYKLLEGMGFYESSDGHADLSAAHGNAEIDLAHYPNIFRDPEAFFRAPFSRLVSFAKDAPNSFEKLGKLAPEEASLFQHQISRMEKFGIHDPSFIPFPNDPSRIIENWDAATSKRDKRPVALVVQSTEDWNGAFDPAKYEKLFEGYRVLYTQAKSDSDLITISKEFSKATKGKKADLIVIGGHGTKTSLALGGKDERVFGQEHSRSGHLDVGDRSIVKEAFEGKVAHNADIVLYSCSNAKGGFGSENLATMIAETLEEAHVHAFPRPSNGDFVLREDGTFKEFKLVRTISLGPDDPTPQIDEHWSGNSKSRRRLARQESRQSEKNRRDLPQDFYSRRQKRRMEKMDE